MMIIATDVVILAALKEGDDDGYQEKSRKDLSERKEISADGIEKLDESMEIDNAFVRDEKDSNQNGKSIVHVDRLTSLISFLLFLASNGRCLDTGEAVLVE